MEICSDATFYSDALILPLAAFIEKLQYVKVIVNRDQMDLAEFNPKSSMFTYGMVC